MEIIDLIDVIDDTLMECENNPFLKDAIDHSINHTKLYKEDKPCEINIDPSKVGDIRVTVFDTLESAINLEKEFPSKCVAILNFASSKTPGGGVLSGSKAQEESICRRSTLYPCINTKELHYAYYLKNIKEKKVLGTDALIYTPDIYIIKDNKALPMSLNQEDYHQVDVITCAAPNVRGHKEITDEELYKVHLKRAEHILCAAIDNNVDIIVLGAFGCGAFGNNPKVVAKAYKDILKKYRYYFDVVEFAIYSPNQNNVNYDIFKEVLLEEK